MTDIPLTVRRSIELLGLVLVIAILVIAHNIIMPVLMAFFISIMLLPVFRFLRKYKFPEPAAIIIPILLVAILLGLIVWFFSMQVGSLIQDFPQIKRNVGIHLNALSNWVSNISDFSTKEQVKFINDKSNDLLGMAGK